MPDSSSLTPFYLGWSRQNDRLLQALAPLTPDQLLLRSAPHMWPVSVFAAHIIGARVFWFHTIMGEGPATLDAWLGLDDVDESERTLDRLLSGLTASWALIDDVLARCTPANLDDVFERVYPNRVKTFTRQAILLRVLGHDFHHGGEISTILGMHGLAGLDE
jgi:uncharacterized damage-inducible protein DinB